MSEHAHADMTPQIEVAVGAFGVGLPLIGGLLKWRKNKIEEERQRAVESALLHANMKRLQSSFDSHQESDKEDFGDIKETQREHGKLLYEIHGMMNARRELRHTMEG